LGLK
jgi:hypothetical protein